MKKIFLGFVILLTGCSTKQIKKEEPVNVEGKQEKAIEQPLIKKEEVKQEVKQELKQEVKVG